MAKFKLYNDGKFRLATNKGLFSADSSKFSIEEVNAAYANGDFQEASFKTKAGDKVYFIGGEPPAEVGEDVATHVTVHRAVPQEVVEIELDYDDV